MVEYPWLIKYMKLVAAFHKAAFLKYKVRIYKHNEKIGY